jgi:glycerophosphoryl diester phosphodiesterase
MTRRETHPALRGRPIGFAHRGFTPASSPPGAGAHLHAWENTIEAFRAAMDLGLRHLETDVHATVDGVPVFLHDPDLSRTAGRDVAVSTVTWAELAEVRVAGQYAVPRVEEVLQALPEAVLNIDVKDPRAVRPLAAAIAGAGAQERVLVASFDGRRARAVQRLVPGVARSAGMVGSAAARLSAAVDRVSRRLGQSMLLRAAAGADALQLPERAGRLRVVTPRLVSLAHDVGVQVHVWTVDDPADMERLLDLGVDGLMSDRADLLSQVLSRRAG